MLASGDPHNPRQLGPLANLSLSLYPAFLDHIQFLCAVDGSRWMKDMGWQPHHSMRDTIRSARFPS